MTLAQNPSIPHINRMRRRRRQKINNSPNKRFGFGCAILFGVLSTIMIFIITLSYANLSQGLPNLNNIPNLLEPPDGLLFQPSRFYDRSGQHIIFEIQNANLDEQTYFSLEETQPISLIAEATVAVSDPTFWQHPGFTLIGLFQRGEKTIAQRLVADLLLWDEPTGIRRDFREQLIAWQITSQYGRAKVLEWYLNSANYGNRTYGVNAAAQVYFGKSGTELNLAEAALLAAVNDSPALNPFDAPQAAIERIDDVISNLLDRGVITGQEASQAIASNIEFNEPRENLTDLSSVFTNLVFEQLSSLVSLPRIERGGFKVITTLNLDYQNQATCSAQAQLERLNHTQSNGTHSEDPSCPAARLLPTLPLPSDLKLDEPQATLVILDPKSGQVLALVGKQSPGLDPTRLPGNPPGSLLTPFVYLTSFTRGFSPSSLVWDIPSDLYGRESDTKIGDMQFNGPVSMRVSLANDYLTPALQLLSQIGPENAWHITKQMGMVSLKTQVESTTLPGCLECSLLLRDGEITLIEIVQAFGAFANQGVLVGQTFRSIELDLPPIKPITILHVEDNSGKVWLANPDPKTRSVITPQLAYLMTEILSDEAIRWASLGHPNPLEIGRPAGAKIGLVSDSSSVWTVGFTPQIVIGVWMGEPLQSKSAFIEIPPKTAAGLWHALMQYITKDMIVEDWAMPPGISTLNVCYPSGLLPTKECPTIFSEVFLHGNEPSQADNLYQSFQINRETGNLATVFTPPELVDERTYLVIPAEASEWASSVGLVTPPETYDTIYNPPISPYAKITSPEMFAHINGEVPIMGTASADDFSSYRLQVGKGLNPQTWIRIDEDSLSTIVDNTLALWDTIGMDGLYAIQLVVVRSERHVETSTIQVTVDNIPPKLSILYPQEGQRFIFIDGRTLVFQVQASDNLFLENVEFYVDGQRISAPLSNPPYVVPWQISRGVFTLRVIATDTAGNEEVAEVSFNVEE